MQLGKRLEQVLMDKEDAIEQLEALQVADDNDMYDDDNNNNDVHKNDDDDFYCNDNDDNDSKSYDSDYDVSFLTIKVVNLFPITFIRLNH